MRADRYPTWSALAPLCILLCLVDAIASYLSYYPDPVQFDPSGALSTCMPIALLLVATTLGAQLASETESIPAWFLGLLAGWWVIHTSLTVLTFLISKWHLRWLSWGWSDDVAAVWIAVSAAVLIRSKRPSTRRQSALVLLTFLVFVTIPIWYIPRYAAYFEPRDDESTPRSLRLSEDAIYSQNERLQRVTDAIEAGATPTLFFVGMAPSDQNTVFQKEVTAIEKQFEVKYHTARHEAVLSSLSGDGDAPLATRTALKAVLDRVGSVMDREQDVLFLYITSHGSEENGVAVSSGMLELYDLGPLTLRQLLDDSKIKNRVIVISACHAGVYLPALQNDNTIVIAAAAADRQSFGCSNTLDYTYFGQAYFVDGLSQTTSFVDAFKIAKALVGEREKAQGFEPSDPQMVVGAALASYLGKQNYFAH
jgi:hypothetical protein